MRYLIVGTGRCGTGWITEQLRKHGLTWSHEDVFGLQNTYAAELLHPRFDGGSSWLAVPYLPDVIHSVQVFHQVRDPLASLLSFYRLPGNMFGDDTACPYTQFVYGHLPSVARRTTKMDRIAHYYVYWTETIFRYLGHRRVYRIEFDSGRLISDILGQPVTRDVTENKQLLVPTMISDERLRQQVLALRAEWNYT